MPPQDDRRKAARMRRCLYYFYSGRTSRRQNVAKLPRIITKDLTYRAVVETPRLPKIYLGRSCMCHMGQRRYRKEKQKKREREKGRWVANIRAGIYARQELGE